jgi:hypothetical protein
MDTTILLLRVRALKLAISVVQPPINLRRVTGLAKSYGLARAVLRRALRPIGVGNIKYICKNRI